MTEKTTVRPSDIAGAGLGLFALVFIPKGAVICTYGGRLVDPSEIKFCSPAYVVEFQGGRNFKLDGDDLDGHVGCFINSTHPDRPESVNAKFTFAKKSVTDCGSRGYFHVVAKQDIEAGSEIIVNYGANYWRTLAKWDALRVKPTRPAAVVSRNARARERASRRSIGTNCC